MKPGVSLRYLSAILSSLVAVWAPGAAAQDLCSGLVTDTARHPMTSLEKPAVGEAAVDAEFGTTIRRITAAPAGGVIKPMYSTISAWNADESLLILYKVGSGHQLYDGKTYAFLRSLNISPADLEQVYWDTVDPDILYYVDGNRFIRYHVSSDAKETLTTFSFCSSASGGGDPMYISWDPPRIGLGCGSERFIYDVSSNTVVGRRAIGGDVPQMAPSGNLAFIDGEVVNTSLDTVRTLDLGNPSDHASLGRTADGHDAYFGVAFDEGPGGSDVGSLVLHDMTDASWRVIVGPATGYPYPPSGHHISAVAHRRPGWVAVSIVGRVAGQNVLDNELLLANTAPGGSVCRIAHHRSYGKNGSQGYWAEPHAVPSPSGTRVLFGSDWGNSGTVDAFVVELPSYGSEVPALRVADQSVIEGNSGAVDAAFDVDLDPAGTSQVTVDYGTSAGTAAAGSDYVSASGSLTFAPGETTKTVSIEVNGDTEDEPDETFYLLLSNASGATIADDQAVGTIVDDDDPPPLVGISIDDVSVAEGHSGATSAGLTASLSAASTQTVTVDYTTADGSATAGSDYAATAGSVSFSPGVTSQTISVSITGDTVVEPDEIFVVNLTSPAGGTLADSQGQVTITNDDTAPPSGEAVIWTNTVGATAEGNSVTKTASTSWGNAGASSTRALDGDGYVEFAVPAHPGYAMFGLSNGDTDQDYADVDFAFYAYPATGQLLVFENGTYRATVGSYAAGDTLRVGMEAGAVRYQQNGSLVYTSSQTPTMPLRVDTSLYSTGAVVQDARLSGTVVDVEAPATELVSWANAIGLSVAGNSVTKTASTSWGNAGASSTRALDGDGYVEFAVPAHPGYAMFGLSNGDTDQDYADIDFAFYAYPATGQLLVFENGTYRATVGSYAAGDTLRVGMEAGAVRYHQNGSLVYTSSQTPTLPLRVDTSLYSTGAVVQDARLSGTVVDVEAPATELVSWANAIGLSVAGNSVTKTASTSWGNAGASSTRALDGDGYVEFAVPAHPGYAMFGLSNGDTDQDYADIDFAFYTYPATGQLLVFESGTYRATVSSYAAGDTLRVGLASNSVKYYRNGSLVYTSSQTPTLPLRVDTSLYSTGAVVQDARLSGTVVDVEAPATELVSWANAIGLSVAGNSVTKTASTSWGNAGASSTRALDGDGYVEFAVPAHPGYAMFGLSNGDTDQDYADIDFAFYTYPATGQLLVFESGTYRATVSSYAAGDTLRVGLASNSVKYYRNGSLVYTSSQTPTLPLRVDTSLYSTGASVNGVVLSGVLQ